MSIISVIVKPLAYVSLPVFALHTLAKASPAARYYVRLALYLSTLGVCSAWGVVCAMGLSLVGRRLDVFWVVARSFYALASRAIDIRLVLEGEEHLQTRPAVLVGNHQSMLDILYLGRYTSISRVPESAFDVLRATTSGYSRCTRPSLPRKSCSGLPSLVSL